jgi:CheY-like chemotaxis protein
MQMEDTGQFKSASAAVDTLAAIELPRLDGVSVLVVDDEPDARGFVTRILEGRGARALPVANMDEALTALRGGAIDILLSDIGMPEADGYELMHRVRTLDVKAASRVPAIALTAYARPEDRQRSLLAGYQMHISKPVEARELIAGIASLLKVAR